MNASNTSMKNSLSRVMVMHKGANLTNASFRWCPNANMPTNASGRMSVSLLNSSGQVTADAVHSSSTNSINVSFLYFAAGKMQLSERIPMSKNAPLHLELDIDAKTSNIVMWINDKGYDMGVIPGFKGGANSARWIVGGYEGQEKLAGKLVDCVVANSVGWRSPVFQDKHIYRNQLHDDHSVEISRAVIAVGSNSSLV